MDNQDEFRHGYLMNRRAFVGMAAAGAASPLLARAGAAEPALKARNVVLVHGLFADGVVLVRSHRAAPAKGD